MTLHDHQQPPLRPSGDKVPALSPPHGGESSAAALPASQSPLSKVLAKLCIFHPKGARNRIQPSGQMRVLMRTSASQIKGFPLKKKKKLFLLDGVSFLQRYFYLLNDMSAVVIVSCHIMTGIIVEIFSLYFPLQSQRAAVIWNHLRHLPFVSRSKCLLLVPDKAVRPFPYNTNKRHFDLDTKGRPFNQYQAQTALNLKKK